MTVEQAYKILKDSKMANKECNFKVSGTKRTSKLDLILQRLDKHEEMFNQIFKRLDKIDEFIVEQKQFNKYVLDQFKKHGWTK